MTTESRGGQQRSCASRVQPPAACSTQPCRQRLLLAPSTHPPGARPSWRRRQRGRAASWSTRHRRPAVGRQNNRQDEEWMANGAGSTHGRPAAWGHSCARACLQACSLALATHVLPRAPHSPMQAVLPTHLVPGLLGLALGCTPVVARSLLSLTPGPAGRVTGSAVVVPHAGHELLIPLLGAPCNRCERQMKKK